MMFAVVLLYGICWTPIKIYQIILNFYPDIFSFCSSIKYYILVGIYFFCHFVAMTNSFVNPIIYSFMSKSFRVSKQMINIKKNLYTNCKEF